MSKVNLVRKLGTDKLYALKMMNIHRAFDEGQVSNTLREKSIMSLLKHPFIARLHTTFKDTSHVCFLLEYIPGGDLFDIMKKKGKLPVEDAKFYAARLELLERQLEESQMKSEKYMAEADILREELPQLKVRTKLP